MQTFIPYPDFRRTAEVLDNKRLGNQAYNECRVLINGGWPNHPASKMWQGYDSALARYAIELLEELARRTAEWYGDHIAYYSVFINDDRMPPWWGDDRVHASHRAALLHKYPTWYSQFNWTEEPSLDYYWPV